MYEFLCGMLFGMFVVGMLVWLLSDALLRYLVAEARKGPDDEDFYVG